MKKYVMLFALMIGLVTQMSAQKSIIDYGTLKDNWYFGGGVGTNLWNNDTDWTVFNTKTRVINPLLKGWWKTQPVNANLYVGKLVTPYVGLELDYSGTFNVPGAPAFMDTHNLTASGLLNLNNFLGGYKGHRRGVEFEALAGAGWFHNYTGALTDGQENDRNAVSVRGAIRTNFNLSKTLSLTVTPEYVWLPRNLGDAIRNKQSFNLSVGMKYRVNTERGGFKYVKLYDANEVEALNSTINDLRREYALLLDKANNTKSENSVVVKNEVATIGVILFDKGSYKLRNTDLSKIAELLNKTNGQIVLTGNISPEGSEGYNRELAMNRANIVRVALVNHGVPSERIVVKNEYERERSVVITVE